MEQNEHSLLVVEFKRNDSSEDELQAIETKEKSG